MPFFAAVDAPWGPESMKFPVNSLLAGNSAFRDGFARDCLLQRRVRREPVNRSVEATLSVAAIYSLIESAKLNGLNPQHYLTDVLVRIADHPARRIAELLPWNWQPFNATRAAA